jgi:hypothetical protein
MVSLIEMGKAALFEFPVHPHMRRHACGYHGFDSFLLSFLSDGEISRNKSGDIRVLLITCSKLRHCNRSDSSKILNRISHTTLMGSYHSLFNIVHRILSACSWWPKTACPSVSYPLPPTPTSANVSADIAERCLGHAMLRIRGTYDQHDYVPQMKLAFESLARLIERIVEPQHNALEKPTQR